MTARRRSDNPDVALLQHELEMLERQLRDSRLQNEALRAENELGMHVRAALRNGLGAEEIREVILHTAVYAGVPAANAAFAVAKQVLSEDGVI